jgi:CxxC motif-containing protein/thioredoxin reductase
LLLERDVELGGILLQCIHNGFGLHVFKEELSGPSYAERYVEHLKNLGIEYKTHSMAIHIGEDKVVEYANPFEGYVQIKGKAIILAMGCRERTRGAVMMPGFRPSGIWTAGTAQRYLNMEGYMVGRKIFILGSGDIGLIMARRMTLEGAQVLGVAEIMPYSNGLPRNQKQCLEDFGIPLYLSHTVTDILGKDRLEGVVISAVDGTLRPIPGTEKKFEADTLLLSVGLIPENELSEEAHVLLHPQTKGAVVSESLETSVPGIFACGNVLHVHDLVDFVSEEGRRAGISAAAYVQGELQRGRSFQTAAGAGIGYVLPQKVHPDHCSQSVEFMFRVTNSYRGAGIRVLKDGVLYKTIPRLQMAPAEMEKIILKQEEIADVKTTLTLEVGSIKTGVKDAGSLIRSQTDIDNESQFQASSGAPVIAAKGKSKGSLQNDTNHTEQMGCIVCPMSCHMTITLSQGGEVLSVTGNTCKRGEEYARQEMLAPTRTLTSTVKLDGGLYRRLPVITSSNIPKNRIMDVMQEINRVSARAPVQRGQILIEDVCGLGVNIIASRSIQKSEQ